MLAIALLMALSHVAHASEVEPLLVGEASLRAVEEVPEFLVRAHYPTRSGQLYVAAKQQQLDSVERPAGVDEVHASLASSNAQLPVALTDTQLAALLSAHSGLPAPARAAALAPAAFLDEAATSDSSLLLNTPPRAHILAVLDHVDGAHHSPALPLSAPHTVRSPLVSTAAHADTFAALATLLTGQPPFRHGIVAAEWPTAERPASMSPLTQRLAPTIHDAARLRLLQENSRPLLVTAAGCVQPAALLTPHSSLQDERTLTAAYHPSTRQVEAVTEAARQSWIAESLTAAQYLGNALDLSFVAAAAQKSQQPLTVSAGEQTITVKLDSQVVTFDLQQADDSALFVELQLCTQILSILQQEQFQAALSDGVTDLFTLSFVAIRHFAVDSPKYNAAIALIDARLATFADELIALYGSGEVITDVVTLHPRKHPKLEAKLVAVTKSSIGEFLFDESSLRATLPEVYLSQGLSLAQIAASAAKLRESLLADGMTVYDLSSCSYASHEAMLQHLARASDDTTNYTYNEISSFQIFLWMSIALAAAVIAAVCPICYMDYENDALYMKSTLVSTGFEG